MKERMLANAALACLAGRVAARPAFPCNRPYPVYFASVCLPQDVIPRFLVFLSGGRDYSCLPKRYPRRRTWGRGRLRRSGGRWLFTPWRQLGSVPPPSRPPPPRQCTRRTAGGRGRRARRPRCASLTLTACIALQAEQSSDPTALPARQPLASQTRTVST